MISYCQVCVSHILRILQVRVCVMLCSCRMLHRHFLHSSEWGPRPSQPGQCRSLPSLSRMFLLRCVRRDATFVHSPVERASANFSLALPKIELSGFHGSPTQNNQDLLIPRIAAKKSSRHSPQCATWCQQKELICLLVFASKHSCVPSEFTLYLICTVVSEQAKNSQVRSNSFL